MHHRPALYGKPFTRTNDWSHLNHTNQETEFNCREPNGNGKVILCFNYTIVNCLIWHQSQWTLCNHRLGSRYVPVWMHSTNWPSCVRTWPFMVSLKRSDMRLVGRSVDHLMTFNAHRYVGTERGGVRTMNGWRGCVGQKMPIIRFGHRNALVMTHSTPWFWSNGAWKQVHRCATTDHTRLRLLNVPRQYQRQGSKRLYPPFTKIYTERQGIKTFCNRPVTNIVSDSVRLSVRIELAHREDPIMCTGLRWIPLVFVNAEHSFFTFPNIIGTYAKLRALIKTSTALAETEYYYTRLSGLD